MLHKKDPGMGILITTSYIQNSYSQPHPTMPAYLTRNVSLIESNTLVLTKTLPLALG